MAEGSMDIPWESQTVGRGDRPDRRRGSGRRRSACVSGRTPSS